ncbi:MAG: rRNA methyltransferase [Micavibrio aeruginosavorus]|uniref:Ribosomal RNA large subunit methyltransferase E n=1 Tax=Micavibrio aeruginosavorus TaxID=349221 RepID=A0A2W5N0X9_9BACT|nr:MAG: rRNA methyltransferase [Micavibrio aeruginosavorus]
MKKIKTAKGRKISSIKWIERQLNDPYVVKAKAEGYRSRAAYKLIEINDKAHIIKKGQTIVDLGAAPGGWCQVAVAKDCKVVAIDLLPMDEIPGVTFFQMDFMDDNAPETLIDALGGGGADVVMSDIAHNTTGHQKTDHYKIMALVEAAYDFAIEVLKSNGTFIAKVFQGGTEGELLTRMKKDFKTVKHIKPPASRKESPETYVVAQGFRAVK